ncbi:FRIM protein, partial [Amia calva]|nr:FRIM protein [Amia calva]
MASPVRQNFHSDSEAALNQLINLKLSASYTYLSLAFYFDRDDIALPNFSRFFRTRSESERQQADKLLGYQNERGGRVLLQTVLKPSQDEWGSGLFALSACLQLQRGLNQSLLSLHSTASTHSDAHITDFLEGHFLTDSVDFLKTLGDHIASLSHITSCQPKSMMGEYLFDKHSL